MQHVEKLHTIADKKEMEIAHVVLAWYLTREAIDVVIPGAKHGEQVLSNLQALKVQLTEKEINEIDHIFAN